MEPTDRTPVRLLRAQYDYLRAVPTAHGVIPRLLGYGGLGSGKTLALCLRLASRAAQPGAREGLSRKHLTTLKGTTIRTLLVGDGDMPPVLPGGTYTHRRMDRTISLRGGGEIVYFGLDDPAKVGSLNLTGCAVDQAEEYTLDDWRAVEGRCRVSHSTVRNELYAVCNPGVPSHWLAEEFGLALDHKPQPGAQAIHLPTAENLHTPAAYRATLAAWTGVRRARFFEGKWVGSDGLIYPDFSREVHVRRVMGKPARVVVGVDDGFTHPFAAIRVEVDGDGRAHVAAERYQSGLQESGKVGMVLALADGAEAVVVDPSAAGLRSALQRAGLCVLEADNDVRSGIGRVGDRLTVAGDGLPRLTVAPECVKTIMEFESYEWAKGLREVPVKENDHACFPGDTLVETCGGPRRIDALSIGDRVLTPFGADTVELVACTGVRRLLTIEHEYGELKGTPDHPVWTDQGFVRMDTMRYGDIIAAWTPRNTALTGDQLASMMRRGSAPGAAGHSCPTDTAGRGIVLSRVLGARDGAGIARVYSLKTERFGVYFASGVLVSNCDALRYTCMYLDHRPGTTVYRAPVPVPEPAIGFASRRADPAWGFDDQDDDR